MKRPDTARLVQAAWGLHARLARLCLPLGVLLALALSAGTAALNVSAGPLGNLNDIGGWDNRLLFILMTAAVQAGVLLLCALMHRGSLGRLALRQLTLTAGLLILLMGINQKTYAYVQVVQPIVRAMDTGALAAGLAMESAFSAPALTLLYLVTRGPVYDMYLVKLLAIACVLLISLLAVRAADARGWGFRADALLALLMILPQAFLQAGCAAQLELVCVLLLACALAAMDGGHPRPLAAALCFGGAVAVSGAALYALPLLLVWTKRGALRPRHWALAAVVPLAALIPALLSGMGAGDALLSLLRANLSMPQYAAGSPGFMSIIPRANPLEMPQLFMLRRVEELDLVTNAQPFYTQAHFEQVMRGLIVAAAAVYAALAAWLTGRRDMSPLRRAMALVLSALYLCPAATMGAWLALDVLCVMALVREPRLRLPSCILLFATAGAGCYPVTEELLLPVAASWALCGAALCMLAGIIPMGREKEADRA